MAMYTMSRKSRDMVSEIDTETVVGMLREFFEQYLLPNYVRKNRAYAQTDTTKDAFSNFRRNAQRWGITEEQAWGNLWGKHVDAIETWVRTGETPDRIYRILNDSATYCLMQIVKLAADDKISWDEIIADGRGDDK